jgi:hypothetical protein
MANSSLALAACCTPLCLACSARSKPPDRSPAPPQLPPAGAMALAPIVSHNNAINYLGKVCAVLNRLSQGLARACIGGAACRRLSRLAGRQDVELPSTVQQRHRVVQPIRLNTYASDAVLLAKNAIHCAYVTAGRRPWPELVHSPSTFHQSASGEHQWGQ